MADIAMADQAKNPDAFVRRVDAGVPPPVAMTEILSVRQLHATSRNCFAGAPRPDPGVGNMQFGNGFAVAC
ncbi:hypothetical protein [Mesorhizobium sp. CN2-181]|uniref:hypothetical protein n=1 Tax=Mesorhizobium yinganensis TaxID=3157707 RepID=UPI0032B7EF2E